MKKFRYSFIAVILVLAMAFAMSIPAFAATNPMELTVDKKEVMPGETVTFTITVNSEDGVFALQADVEADARFTELKTNMDGFGLGPGNEEKIAAIYNPYAGEPKNTASVFYTYTVSKNAKVGDTLEFKLTNVKASSGNADNMRIDVDDSYSVSVKVIAEQTPTPSPSTDVEPTPTAESTPTTNPSPTAEPSTSPEATPTIEPTPTIAPTASPTAAPTETPTNTPAPTENPWSGWIPPTGSYTPPTSGNNISGPGESSAGVNKTGLNTAIGVAKNTLAGGTNYSAEAASALSSAIAKAEAISSDPNATQAQVDAGTALVDAVSAAAARTADGKTYTDETIAALNAALAEAKAVCDDPAATIEQINNVIGKLNAAVAGLTEAPAVTEPPKDDVPKTADESVAVWPFALLMLAAGAAAVVLFRKKSLNGR